MKKGATTVASAIPRQDIPSTTTSCWRLLFAPLSSLVGFFRVTPIPPAELQESLKRADAAIESARRSIKESEKLMYNFNPDMENPVQTYRS